MYTRNIHSGSPYNVIIDILAFLGALRNYSYIDRLGNAIDELSIYESISEAIRTFYSICGRNEKKDICVKISDELKIKCPEIKYDKLIKATDMISKEINTKSRAEIIKLARELALKAYAEIPKHLQNKCSEDKAQKEAK